MTGARIEGDFPLDELTLALADEVGMQVPRLLDNAVLLNTTTGESVGYVMVDVEDGFLGEVAYLSPGRARELAFALMDIADVVEIAAGTFSLEHDPFEDLVARQASSQISDLL